MESYINFEVSLERAYIDPQGQVKFITKPISTHFCNQEDKKHFTPEFEKNKQYMDYAHPYLLCLDNW